jgi:hypothetical protein
VLSDRRAFLVDLSFGTVVEVDAPAFDDGPILSEHLVALSDGSVAEIGLCEASASCVEGGAALRRFIERTPFDHPPLTIGAEDRAWIVRDAPDRWSVTTDGIVACTRAGCTSARLHIPTLTFTHFSAELDVVGRGVLRLRSSGLPDVLVTHEDDAVRTGLCEIERAAGETIRIERDGNLLELWSESGDMQRCAVELGVRVSLSIEVPLGGVFRAIRLARL